MESSAQHSNRCAFAGSRSDCDLSGSRSLSELVYSFFSNTRTVFPDVASGSFADLVGLLEYASTFERPRADKAATMCVVPARFEPERRAAANVVARCAFTGDVDGDAPGDGGFDWMAEVLSGLGVAYAIHSTTKSDIKNNRYRVILPFSAPVTADEYVASCWCIHSMLGEVFDTKTFDPARLSILPQRWTGEPPHYPYWDETEAHHGLKAETHKPAIDVAWLRATFPAERPRLVPTVPSETVATRISEPPPFANFDDAELTDFERSPLVTAKMVSAYNGAVPGGRFFSFMCAAACRAFAMGLPCDPHVILQLGLEMNSRGPRSQRRTDGLREANRAVTFAAGATSNTRYQKTYNRLKDIRKR